MPVQWSWLIADRCPGRFSDKDKTQRQRFSDKDKTKRQRQRQTGCDLPVDVPVDVENVEEHLSVGKEGSHGQR